jgi:lipopolysaccharide biosynthesis protein
MSDVSNVSLYVAQNDGYAYCVWCSWQKYENDSAVTLAPQQVYGHKLAAMTNWFVEIQPT